jgi:alpha-L-fucosidase
MIYLTVLNKPMNNLLRVKVPKSDKKDLIYVIESAKLIAAKKTAAVRDGGRDKAGSIYYDIVLPSEIQKINEPFVIEIKLKQVNKGEKDAYQQAIT